MLNAPPEPVIVLELAIPLLPIEAMFCRCTSLGDGCKLAIPVVLRALLPFLELPPPLRDSGRPPALSSLMKLPVLSASTFVIFKFLSFSEASKIGVLFEETFTYEALCTRLLGGFE